MSPPRTSLRCRSHSGRFHSAVLWFLVFSLAGLRRLECTRSLDQAKEPGTRPMCPGNPLRNHAQRAIALAVVFEPFLAHKDGMGMSAPLPNQGRAGLQHYARVERTSAFLELCRQNLQAALQGAGRAGVSALLELIGEASDDQIATEPQGRSGMMQCLPRTPQLLCRLTNQSGNLAFKVGQVQASQTVVPVATSTGNGRRLARVLASRSIVDWRFHRLSGSAMRYTRPRSSLAEARVSPSFFFKVPEKTPRTVWRCQPVTLATSSTVTPSGRRSIAMTSSCFDGRLALDGSSGSGNISIADHSSLTSASRSPTFPRFSTPGRAFHSARSRLPLSAAACSSSFEATTISPSSTVAGGSRQRVIPSLPMI